MDDLISRKAAMKAAKHAWSKGIEPSQYIEIIPTVPAVPLDKLCEWLAETAGLPTDDLMISKMAWKRKITKWMEGCK